MTVAAAAVVCPAPAALNAATALSWSAWAKLDSTTGSQIFVSRPASPWGDQSFLIGAINGWLYAQVTTNGVSAQLFAGGTIAPGAWVHLAATYDGAQLRFFVNGQPVGQKAATGALRTDSPTAPLVAGGATSTAASAGAPGSVTQGLVAPAIVYGRVLTATDIAALFAAGRPGTPTPPPTTTTTTTMPPATPVPTTTTTVPPPTPAPTTTTTVPPPTPAPTTTTTSPPPTPAPTTTTTTQPPTNPPGVTISGLALTGSMTSPGIPVSVPSSARVAAMTAFTVSAWVKVDATAGDQTYLSMPGSPWGDQTFILGAFSGWVYGSVATKGSGAQLFTGGTIQAGVWTHLAATYNGSAWSLYVNGVLVATRATAGLPRMDNPSAPMYVGGRTGNSSTLPAPTAAVNGLVAPGRLYDRALTAAEIQQEFSAGR